MLFGEHVCFRDSDFFMHVLLQVCFTPAFYPVSDIEIEDGAQLFPPYRLRLCQSKGTISFF